MSLHIRISDTELHLARLEAGNPPQFECHNYLLRPQLPLLANLREAVSQTDFPTSPHERVEVLVSGPVTPVPLAEFQEEDVHATYNFCFSPEGKRNIFYDTVPACNVVLLFALSTSVCRTLEEFFGQVRFSSVLTAVVQHWGVKSAGTARCPRFCVYPHDGVVDIAILEDKHLIMLNSYRVQSLNDAVYYVFNLARHLGLNAATMPFFVCGCPSLRDPLVKEFRRYAEHVFPSHPAADFNRHPVTASDDVPYDLMCALAR